MTRKSKVRNACERKNSDSIIKAFYQATSFNDFFDWLFDEENYRYSCNDLRNLKRICDELKIDYNELSQKNGKTKGLTEKTFDEVFVKNSTLNRSTVRALYLKLNIEEYRCSLCGISEWDNLGISLHLDHINGDHHDNRIKNLRWVCPNCDSQLDTFRKDYEGNTGQKVIANTKCEYCGELFVDGIPYCVNPACSEELSNVTKDSNKITENINNQTENFARCSSKHRKPRCPDRAELKKLIRNYEFEEVAKMFDRSVPTIFNWCYKYKLPTSKDKINSLSNEEWEKEIDFDKKYRPAKYDYKSIVEAYKQIQNLTKTAEAIGCSVDTVKKACQYPRLKHLGLRI